MQDVEIWRVELSQPPALVGELARLLDVGERARAARMAAAPQWIVARAALRIVLAGKLAAEPGDVALRNGAHGKPHVPGAALRFNLSHSGDAALIAVCETAEVGIDVERTTRRSRAIERALTPAERTALAPADDRHTALLQIWCRKEALAKAHGVGLGWAPERFDTTAPGEFTLADLELAGPYVGALAVAGDLGPIVQRRLNLDR